MGGVIESGREESVDAGESGADVPCARGDGDGPAAGRNVCEIDIFCDQIAEQEKEGHIQGKRG